MKGSAPPVSPFLMKFPIWKLRIIAAAIDARLRAQDLRQAVQRREIKYYQLKARLGFGAEFRWKE